MAAVTTLAPPALTRCLIAVLAVAGLLAGCAAGTDHTTGGTAGTATAAPTRRATQVRARVTPPPAVTVAPAPPVHGEEQLSWAGIQRSAATWKPARQTAPMPLLLVLAGRRSSPLGEQLRTHLDDLARQGRAVVVFPRQLGRSWNAGVCCDASTSDDSGFLAALVRQLVQERVVDPHRVYASGFSVGGMMAYRLACDHPTLLAGVASVGGVEVAPCPAHFRVPLLEIHSRLDTEVPLAGTRSSDLTGPAMTGLPAVGAALQNWRIRNGCASNLYVGHATHAGPLEIRDVRGCPPGATVRLVQTLGASHAWSAPGTDTSAMVWQFLAAQAR